jgi:ABC-type uncharacterized transport system substrate-binding protein
MRRRDFITLVGGSVAAWPLAAGAQQAERMRRIGVLMSRAEDDPGNKSRVTTFRQTLESLGWWEGRTVHTQYRFAGGKPEHAPSLAAELVAAQPDVILVESTANTAALQRQTRTIPIVFTLVADPIGSGFVASLARPGGNLTGISTLAQDLNAKRLELLMEVVPRLLRVAVLRDVDSQTATLQFKEYEAAARVLKIELHSIDVKGPNPDLENALLAATKGRNDALITITNANLFLQQKRLADLAIRNKLPSMFQGSTWVDSGGLMSYSTDEIGAFRRAAAYVDKILKGTKPADLPVEQMTKFEFAINLKTAKQIGLNIPQSVLFRVDRVVR